MPISSTVFLNCSGKTPNTSHFLLFNNCAMAKNGSVSPLVPIENKILFSITSLPVPLLNDISNFMLSPLQPQVLYELHNTVAGLSYKNHGSLLRNNFACVGCSLNHPYKCSCCLGFARYPAIPSSSYSTGAIDELSPAVINPEKL